MKEMNSLETQLGSWKPRPPSAKIKRRLFPAPHARPELVRMLNWLAPATACMLLALAAFRQESGLPTAPLRHDPSVAMMLSNQNTVAFLAEGQSQIEHNVLPPTLGWTNRNGSTLNNGFTPFTKPNQ
jgi:hypothetical protein